MEMDRHTGGQTTFAHLGLLLEPKSIIREAFVKKKVKFFTLGSDPPP